MPQTLHIDLFTTTASLPQQISTATLVALTPHVEKVLHVLVAHKDNCQPLRTFLDDVAKCTDKVSVEVVIGDLGTRECDVWSELSRSGLRGQVLRGESKPGQWCRSRALNTALSAVPENGLALVLDAGMRVPCSLLEGVESRVFPGKKVCVFNTTVLCSGSGVFNIRCYVMRF